MAAETVKMTVSEQIKNKEFSNLILLTGDEAYLVQIYKKQLVEALIDETDNMNFVYYRDDKINELEVIDFASTMPFFSDRRVILIENSGYFKKTPEKLLNKIKEFPDTTFIIFVEKDIDKRSKFYKEIINQGVVGEYNTPSDKELLIWIKKGFMIEGIEIEDSAVYKLLECVGSQMNLLYNEMEKLKSYISKGEKITVNHIDEISISQAENKVFEMLDLMASKNIGGTIKLYKDLMMLKEPAMRILSLIVRHFNILLDVKVAMSTNDDKSKMASALRIPPFAVAKYKAQVKAYTKEELLQIVEMCQEIDLDIKKGKQKDTIAVEMLIIHIIKGIY